jgi:hypothetical protein
VEVVEGKVRRAGQGRRVECLVEVAGDELLGGEEAGLVVGLGGRPPACGPHGAGNCWFLHGLDAADDIVARS